MTQPPSLSALGGAAPVGLNYALWADRVLAAIIDGVLTA